MKLEGKLELTWVGKNEEIKLEPRILVEDKSKSYGDPNTENMLIHGDNLLALKALEKDFAGKIKCIYIDPPYNTGSAFEYYEDGLEHSEWLCMMKPRLDLLKKLLTDDGVIFIQIDDNEQAYLKVLCDEIFGRNNYLNTISVKMKNIAGASGGGEDRRLKKNIEYIMVYTKNYDLFKWINNAYDYTELSDLVEDYRKNEVSWKYTSVIYDSGEKVYIDSTLDGDGNEIKIYQRKNPIFKSISQIMKEEGIDEKLAYYKYINKIYTTAMPQSSIRLRVLEKLQSINHTDFELISIEYIPKTGKNKGKIYEQFYKGDKLRLFAWLKDVVIKKNDNYYKKDLQGTYWDGINLNNLTKEGSVTFPSGKKPEALIQRIIDMTTQENDFVLDSFLGSGTTTAVAHKMKRKWIGIEMGNQAYSHCKVRMDKIVDGNDTGGITTDVNWQGGGGYKFYELAESLLVKNKKLPIYQINPNYTFEMMCEAICKIVGFDYKPEGSFHGKSSENRFIHITTEFVNAEYIKNLSKELAVKQSLLIYSTKFETDLRLPDNIVVKKIPKDLLKKCKFESEVR